jgi:ATP-dependent Lhr-like helicase
VETVIVDEIHAVVGTKRGAHLALSLERLEALRRAANPDAPPLQRIGLSATQRPLSEVAAFLGGFEVTLDPATPQVPQLTPRPVTVVDAGRGKTFALRVELPPEVEAEPGTEPAGSRPAAPSIWPSLHARLLALIQEHHTTLVFVNSRRLAERLAQALNDLAGTEVARAHHGSISKEARAELEGRLKLGTLPAVVATSSLELGIDMGAVDLVVQIEAPPSVASGIQRIGRAGHQVGAVSKGVLFPTHRSDLLACAALVQHVHAGHVEETRYLVNPLDVLAQQVVAMLAAEPVDVSTLYAWVRGAAPFAELPRRAFEGVLDMLSGRYPSDRFAELRPRITWDRVTGRLEARRGARLLAVVNGGTIPDRGLYGVYLAGAEKPTRLGELDEEMVFESQPATCSSWAPPAGAWTRSRTTACWWCLRRAKRGACRSGRASAPRGRSSSGGSSASSRASSARSPRQTPSACCRSSTAWTRSPPPSWSATSPSSVPPPGPCPATGPSCSSASPMRWGTAA